MSAHNDAAFLRMFLLVLGALVVFTVLILIAASTITSSVEEARGEDPRERAAVAERIRPVGAVNVTAPAGGAAASAAPVAAAPPAAAAPPKSGAEVVAAACNNCHVAGVLGAPKIGDKAAWEQRLAAGGGMDALILSVINGKGAMPARGGAVLTDAEVRAGVEHMLMESGVTVAGAGPAAAAAAPAEAPPAASVEKPVVEAAVPVAAPASPPPSAGAPMDLAKGESVYGMACLACHATGAAGAPKLGDKAVWAPRIAQGMEVLYASAINGKGAMPPKGGRIDLPDADIQAAVAYMVKAVE